MITTDKYVFFWNGIYSNWYSVKFNYKSLEFSNSEQAFMWEKANYFNDSKTANEILNEPNPSLNKKLGRKVKGFDTDKWSKISYNFMYDVNKEKFEQNPNLLKQLIATETRTLVEASPYDKIWGIGLLEEDAVNIPENKWPGQNLLGKVLTQLRNDFIK